MQVCRHCGWENPEIAAFCTNCGTGIGRGRATGPRFRALGLSGEFEEVRPSSVDAGWSNPTVGKPGSTPGNANSLNRTLVDFPAPELDGQPQAPSPSEGAPSALVPPPAMRNAPIARRTTGPVLLPDEAASSVDIGPAKTEAMQAVSAAAAADAEVEPAAAPAPEAVTEELDTPAEEPSAAAEPPADADAHEPAPEVHASAPREPSAPPEASEEPFEGDLAAFDDLDDVQTTERNPAVDSRPPAEDVADEDGFDDFIDPDRPDSVERAGGVDVPDGDSDGIEIAAPEDSLGGAIDTFARDADVRIEPPSDTPESLDEFEEELELELSTSDLHTVDLSIDDDDAFDPGATSPAMRAMPPPLPAVSLRYILRPFSQRDSHADLVPITDAPVVIGRSEGDVRVGDDDFVSPRHARFSVQDGQLFVDDLESLNGVWLRVRVDVRLGDGDEILVGQQQLRVENVSERRRGAAVDGTRRLGMAVNGRRFRVAQLADDGEPLDIYHLSAQGCRIGRRLGDLVFTEDTFMSGTHALLVPRDGAVVLKDLSSRNGCWVRIKGRQSLDTGDAVMIGRTVWRIGRPVG